MRGTNGVTYLIRGNSNTSTMRYLAGRAGRVLLALVLVWFLLPCSPSGAYAGEDPSPESSSSSTYEEEDSTEGVSDASVSDELSTGLISDVGMISAEVISARSGEVVDALEEGRTYGSEEPVKVVFSIDFGGETDLSASDIEVSGSYADVEPSGIIPDGGGYKVELDFSDERSYVGEVSVGIRQDGQTIDWLAFNSKIVIDTSAPVVVGDETTVGYNCSIMDSYVFYLNLNAEGGLELTTQIQDDLLDQDASRLRVEWLPIEASEKSGVSELEPEYFGVRGEWSEVEGGFAGSFEVPKDRFVRGGELYKARLIVEAADQLGHIKAYELGKDLVFYVIPSTSGKTRVSVNGARCCFASENGMLTDDLVSLEIPEGADTIQARGELPACFNGAVNVVVDGSKKARGGKPLISRDDGKTSVSLDAHDASGDVIASETAGSWSDFDYVASVDNGEASACVTYEASIAVETSHRATGTLHKTFVIDNTAPSVSEIALSTPVGVQHVEIDGTSFDRSLYNGATSPTANFEIGSLSSMGGSSDSEPRTDLVTVKLNGSAVPDEALSWDTTDPGVWKCSLAETAGNPSASLFGNAVDERVEVTVENKFGVTYPLVNGAVKPVASSVFMVDRAEPVVALKFSGPVKFVEDDRLGLVQVLFGKIGERIGELTVTVSDPTLDLESLRLYAPDAETELANVSWSSGDSATQASATIPYLATSGVFFGEGNGQTIVVKGGDLAGNRIGDADGTQGYTYAARESSAGHSTDVDGTTSGLPDTLSIDATPVKLESVVFSDAESGDDLLVCDDSGETVMKPEKVFLDGSTRLFDAKSVKVAVTVVDRNFDPDNSLVNLLQSDSPVSSMKGEGENGWTKGSSTSEGDEWRCAFTLNEDGNDFSLGLNANDLFPNETLVRDASTTPPCPRFSIDSSDPVVNVEMLVDATALDDGIDWYGSASDGYVTARITVEDANFIVSQDEESGSPVSISSKSASIVDVSGWTKASEGKYEAAVRFPENAVVGDSYRFDVVARDKLNHSTSYSSGKFTVDLTLPDVNVSVASSSVVPKEGVDYLDDPDANGNIVARITVKDRNFDAAATTEAFALSGSGAQLSQVGWVVGQGEGGDESYLDVTFPESQTGDSYSFSFAAVDKAGHMTAYTYGDNHEAGSTAGSCATASENGTILNGPRLVVDYTYPSVAVTVKEPCLGAEGGIDYYAPEQTDTVLVQIAVQDGHLDEADTSDSLSIAPATSQVISNWEPGNISGEYVATLEFPASEVGKPYSFSVSAVDQSGHETRCSYGENADKQPSHQGGDVSSVDSAGRAVTDSSFVVDTDVPDIAVNIDQTRQGSHEGIDYYGTSTEGVVTAEITVREANFAPTSSVISDAAGGEVNVLAWPDGESWRQDEGLGIWHARVAFAESNGGVASALKVVAHDMPSRVSGGSGGHETSYEYGDHASGGERGGKLETFADGEPTGEGSRSFIVDLTAPELESASASIAYSGAYRLEPASGTQEGRSYSEPYLFYGSPAMVNVVMADNNGLAAGFVKEPFAFEGGHELSDLGLRSAHSIGLIEGVEFSRDIYVTLKDYANNTRSWSIAPTGEITELDVRQGAPQASDNALYQAIDRIAHPMSIILDTIAPKLTWSTTATPGAYYNSTQTIRANVEEFNFDYLQRYDSGQTVVTVSEYEGRSGRASVPHDPITVGLFEGAGSSYGHDIVFDHDGHYSLAASLADPANNASEPRQLTFAEFTIDKTAPVISVSFDNNNAVNGRYYAGPRTAAITVVEHNFAANLIAISTNGAVGGWSSNGDTHTITVSFADDGVYNLSVSGRDLAGNAGASYTADEFTIDTTAPTIAISFLNASTEDQRAFNGIVQPVVTYRDEANFDGSSISCTLSGNKTGEVSYPSSRVDDANGQTITYDDFAHAIGVDDIYTITARVADMAGNQAAEATTTFSVNRFGSNYIVESPESSGNSADLGYLDNPPEIVVREINVTGVDESSVAVTYNLKTTNLQRQTTKGKAGYTVEDASAQARYGWQEYRYTIAPQSFENADGNYVVVLSSRDASGNTNSSANFWVDRGDSRLSGRQEPSESGSVPLATDTESQMSAAVKFTLDTTAPEILGISVSSGEKYNSSGTGAQEVTFTATDNLGYDGSAGVKVKVDGQEVAHRASSDGSGQISFSVPEAAHRNQDIAIVVEDYASNKALLGEDDAVARELGVSASKFSIMVTSDIFDLYGVYIALGAALAVAAAVAAGALLVRRRRAAGIGAAEGRD